MRKRSIFTLAVLLIVILLGVFSSVAAEVTVEATLSHHVFNIDEGARLSIAVRGVRKNANIELPEIDNILLHQRGQSSQTSFVNGKMSTSITYNYIVQGLLPGKYTIPPMKVRAGGEELLTTSISFEVIGAGADNRSTQNTGKNQKKIAFITVSETGEYFPGEMVPITLKAYFNRSYKVELNSLPTLSGDGVILPQLDNNFDQKEEVVDGVPYLALTWQTTLSGIKTGKHRVKFSLDATLLVAQQRRSRSPFSSFGGSMFDDSLLDNFFGNVQRKPITAKSPEIIFNVLPLPEEGRPENFTGAIGHFTMDVNGSPLKVDLGEPITLTMKISGEGNFNRVESPVFPENQAWKTYSPTSEFNADSDKRRGEKSFEQAIVVKQAGVTEIPSLSFSYFDPTVKKFVALQSEPIALQVRGNVGKQREEDLATVKPIASASGGGQPVKVASNIPMTMVSDQIPPTTNLAPIHIEMGTLHGKLDPLFQKVWFIVFTSVCLLLIVVLLYLNWHKQKCERQPGLMLQKKRIQQLQQDLQEVQQAQITGDAALFLNHCRIAIQNNVGAAHLETASAMSLTDLRNQLDENSPLIVIFARAEEAAYGGATLSADEMDHYYRELKIELEKLS